MVGRVCSSLAFRQLMLNQNACSWVYLYLQFSNPPLQGEDLLCGVFETGGDEVLDVLGMVSMYGGIEGGRGRVGIQELPPFELGAR